MIAALFTAIASAGTVTTTLDNNFAGSLRFELQTATAGEVIDFAPAAFPANTVTWIQVLSALPPLAADGISLLGDGRAGIRPMAQPANYHGLVLTGADILVTGLHVENFGWTGILLDEAPFATIGLLDLGNTVEDVGRDGIAVTGRYDHSNESLVAGNVVRGACVNPQPNASCGGIAVRPGLGSGPGDTQILGNVVVETQAPFRESQGTGILLTGGGFTVVANNLVGTPDGVIGEGNLGHGIVAAAAASYGVENPEIRGNTVVANARNGILLGLRSQGALVVDNLIGVGSDGLTSLPNLGVGIKVFGSVGHVIGGELDSNVVSANVRHGIELTGPANAVLPAEIDVGWNTIGLGEDGATPRGNGLDGIRIAPSLVSWSVHDNTISGNLGSGIIADGDTCTIANNIVGLGADGVTDIGNGGDGMALWVFDCTLLENTVSANAGDGIVLRGDRNVLQDNRIGIPTAGLPQDRGNGGDGIRIGEGEDLSVFGNIMRHNGGAGIDASEDPLLTGVTGLVIADSEIQDNALAGIRVVQTAPLASVRFTRNKIWENGGCAYEFDPTNPPPRAAPVATLWGPSFVSGTYVSSLLAGTETIEVFNDAGTEAEHYLGAATITGTDTWEFHVPPGIPLIPAGGRVSATYTLLGATSGIEAYCGDGCAGASAGTCGDGNACTSDLCFAATCSHGTLADGSVCEDTSPCSLTSVCDAGACVVDLVVLLPALLSCDDDNACTADTTCQADGSCGSGSDPELPRTCDEPGVRVPPCYGFPPDAGPAPDCDALLGCGYPERRSVGAVCYDGDRCVTGDTCDGAGTCIAGPTPVVCPDTNCNTCTCDPIEGCQCYAIDEGFPSANIYCSVDDWEEGTDDCDDDEDGDGFPDSWEVFGLDGNCDGDFDDPEDYDADMFAGDPPPIHFEIDWMVDDDHDHDPTGTLDDMVEKYSLYGQYRLEIDVGDPLDHYEAILWGFGNNPSLLRTESYVAYADVKAANFDSARRGIYSYGVIAHRLGEDVAGLESGLAEIPGDDLVVTTGNSIDGQAGALMHEKGHNLGLDHGGDPYDGGQDNAEPNYQSSMNYWYGGGLVPIQLGPIVVVRDYSHERLNDLLESELWETGTPLGGTIDSLYFFSWTCPDECPALALPGFPSIDFDCSTAFDAGAVVADLDNDGVIDELMTGHEDWGSSRMTLDFIRSDGFQADYSVVAAHDEPPNLAERGLLGTRRPRVDVLPGCLGDPELPSTAGRRVPAVIYGSLDLDVGLIDPLRTWVGGAHPISSTLRDVDLDGFVDLVTEQRAQDITVIPATVLVHVGAYTTDGMRVAHTLPASPALDDPDFDGDGIHDACDACPNDATAPQGPDGCPW